MTNPTVPDHLRCVKFGRVLLERHAVVGAGSVILPGVKLALGAAVGTLTVVRKNVPEGGVVYGNPMKFHPRRRNLAKLVELEGKVRNAQDARSGGTAEFPD